MSEQLQRTPLRLAKAADHLPRAHSNAYALGAKVLPRRTSRLAKAALGVARDAAVTLFGNLRPTFPPGRDERFESRIRRVVQQSPLPSLVGSELNLDARVRVLQAFGKPTLVNIDLVVIDPRSRLADARERYLTALQSGVGGESPVDGRLVTGDEITGLALLATDLLDRVTSVAWDNPEVAPVAVRARMLAAPTVDAAELSRLQGTTESASMQVDPGQGLVESPAEAGVAVWGLAEDLAGADLLLDLRDLGFEDKIARSEELFARYGPPASDPDWRPWR